MPPSPQLRRARSRRSRRLPLVAAVVVVAAVAALLLTRGSDQREYRLVFDNASQIVKGGTVRIGGVQAGTVRRISLTRNHLAEVRIAVDERYAPLRAGTTATIRVSGIGSVAARYVDVSPAPSYRPPLRDGARIPVDRTTSVVEVDQVFNTLDPPTRKGLQHAVAGLASSLDGRAVAANESTRQLPRALAALRGLAADVNDQSADFERLMVGTGRAMGALGREPERLTGAISGARGTLDALAGEADALRTTVTDLPGTLAAGSDGLAAVRGALPDVQRLTDAADRSSRDLEPFLQQLGPVLERAAPVTDQLRRTVDQAGPGNDLLDALRDLPALAAATGSSAPPAREALRQATPMLSFVRPYVPDLVAWFRSFGGAAATYDANGHYARSMPVVDAFRLSDGPDGRTLLPKPPGERGRSDALTHGNLRRCPGTAGVIPADGSAPFVDDGPLANADCDPTQRIGAGR